MELIRIINRRELISFYLHTEEENKCHAVPAGYEGLNFDDPDTLDEWLQSNSYKAGAISGFKQWAYVLLSKNDILDTAIVDHIFPGYSQVLRGLFCTRVFQAWRPKEPRPWVNPLSHGYFLERFAVIIRPACKSERKQSAKYYAEDGSGRIICYLRSILALGAESEMTAYLGFDPDINSSFLRQNLGKEFVDGGQGNYTTFEQTLKTIRELPVSEL